MQKFIRRVSSRVLLRSRRSTPQSSPIVRCFSGSHKGGYIDAPLGEASEGPSRTPKEEADDFKQSVQQVAAAATGTALDEEVSDESDLEDLEEDDPYDSRPDRLKGSDDEDEDSGDESEETDDELLADLAQEGKDDEEELLGADDADDIADGENYGLTEDEEEKELWGDEDAFKGGDVDLRHSVVFMDKFDIIKPGKNKEDHDRYACRYLDEQEVHIPQYLTRTHPKTPGKPMEEVMIHFQTDAYEDNLLPAIQGEMWFHQGHFIYADPADDENNFISEEKDKYTGDFYGYPVEFHLQHRISRDKNNEPRSDLYVIVTEEDDEYAVAAEKQKGMQEMMMDNPMFGGGGPGGFDPNQAPEGNPEDEDPLEETADGEYPEDMDMPDMPDFSLDDMMQRSQEQQEEDKAKGANSDNEEGNSEMDDDDKLELKKLENEFNEDLDLYEDKLKKYEDKLDERIANLEEEEKYKGETGEGGEGGEEEGDPNRFNYDDFADYDDEGYLKKKDEEELIKTK